jgi:hypothetical protein
MNQQQAEVIAGAVAIIRPDWLQSSMVKMLAKQRHRPARQVALALVSMAYDPAVKTPGLLNTDGAKEHWAVGQIGEPTVAPYYDRTPVPAEPHPITDPDMIRRIRLAAKADTTQPEGEQQA